MQYTDASPASDANPRRVAGAVALVVGAILGIVGLTAAEGLAYTGPIATPNTSESNKASYWGAGCTKLDRGNGSVSWTADASYSIVVLKSGTTDYAFYDVVAGDVLQIPQDISHFIFCPPTTTTTTTTTTTVPDDTTTTTTTTTTVPDDTTTTTVPDDTTTTTVPDDTTTTTVPDDTTTTTVPDDTTTTTAVGQAGPTTTVVDPTTTTTAVGQQGPTTTVTASGAVTTTTRPAQLPTTGSELNLAVLGGMLMAVGGTLLTLSRRRITV